jgi:hypothetical protein
MKTTTDSMMQNSITQDRSIKSHSIVEVVVVNPTSLQIQIKKQRVHLFHDNDRRNDAE